MAKANTAEVKTYKRSTKFFAVFLPIMAFLTLMISWSIIIEHNQHLDYAHYESCKLIDASAEKQEDGSYIITASIKNDSSPSFNTTCFPKAIFIIMHLPIFPPEATAVIHADSMGMWQ